MHVYCINPFHSGYSIQDPLANSEDPNTIPHKVVFPQGLHCLLRLKQSSGGGGWFQSDYEDYPSFWSRLANYLILKGYFHLCPRMDFLQTLHIINSLYTNHENVFIELDS